MPIVRGQMGTIYYDECVTYTATGSATAPYTIWNSGQTIMNNAATYSFGGTSAVTATAAWTTWTTATYTAWSLRQWQAWQGGIVSAKTKRRAAREQRQAEALQAQMHSEYLERKAKEDEARRQAEQRARALLMTNLTPAQRDSLEKFRFFDIGIAGKTYRIHQGTHGNVRQVVEGKETLLFCAQPDGVPTEDAMLAQKLMLETDEAAFLRVANARHL